jgi:hypothetical protein
MDKWRREMAKAVPLSSDEWRTEMAKAVAKMSPAHLKTSKRAKTVTKPMGRPREHDWPRIYAEIAWRIVKEKPPRVRTRFRDQMLAWCGKVGIKEPAASAMLEAINAMCDRFGYGRKT